MRAPAAERPQVVAAFLAISSAGTPLGAGVAGYAIAHAGFGTTYAAVAAAMTAATVLLVYCVRNTTSVAQPAEPVLTQ
jgi:predicted MFS family arabinose efflux permease